MLDALARRFPWLAPAVAVHQRVSAVGGGPLAASLALAGFLSLFPLLLVGIAVLGFVSAGDVDFAGRVVEDMGLEGEAADQVLDAIHTAEGSRRAATVVGLAGLAWAGLGVVGALDAALNAPWQVTGKGLASRLFGAAWLAGAGLLFLGTLALAPLLAVLPGPAAVPAVLVGFGLDLVLLLWMFSTLTNVAVPWRAHVPGALLGAVALEVLKLVGGLYVPRLVASSSALYGSIGVVFAILAWLLLMARLVVYAATVNVVRYEAGHGTVTVDIQVPHIAGAIPVETTRGGAVAETTEAPGPEA
ncbi:MAG TPA: YihY/virulence factor BrkB family protein [Acidimicrobiales bacterium]